MSKQTRALPVGPWFWLVLALIALLCGGSPAHGQARFEFDATAGILSKDVVPSRYALSWDLDPASDAFVGTAKISLRIRQLVPAIVVHAHQLNAVRVALQVGDGTLRVLHVQPDTTRQTWRLTPADGAPIEAGDYQLDIAYSGRVHRSGEGLFVAPHTVLGKPVRMLATQLEAVFARTLFPGFDEPAFRAVFEISVRAPAGLQVVSNMPTLSKQSDGDRELHRFAPTPPMPSYLVAVAVGRFDALDGQAGGVPLRIFTAPGKRDLARYAMGVTQQVLPFFGRYFGTPYALPKLDQIAVPSTRQGAMEDWGLISYAEDALLFDPARSSPATQRGIFSIVAHELAHQWFGNLVTAASWDEIWLNEAFATWLELKTTEHFNPAWQARLHRRLWTDTTMTRDAGNATRAIRSGPVAEASVFDVFDSITYTKGGAVLSMLEGWIGADVFQRGLAAYVDAQKLSNATAGDLWYFLGQASSQDVAAVASSWTDQKGLPLVEVASECVDETTRVTLRQRRFSIDAAQPSAQLWKIPVRLARGPERSSVLLQTAEQTHALPGCKPEPLLVNAGGEGYYRVAYEGRQRAVLTQGFVAMAPPDRVTLLGDTFALAQAGRLPMADWFALVAQVPAVDDASRAVLFSVASQGLEFLDDAMSGTPTQQRVRAAGRALFAPALDKLGWKPRPQDEPETLKLRGTLIALLGRFDDGAVVRRARRLFDDDVSGKAPLPATIREQVVRVAGMHADRARFEQLLARFKTATGEEDRWTYLRALAGGRDATRAKALLQASLGTGVPPNVAAGIPGEVADRSPFGGLAYDFTLMHWNRLAELAGVWGKPWLLPSAAGNFNDVAQARRLIADQQIKLGPDGASAAARMAARIELMAAVKQRDAATLAAFLEAWRPTR